MKMKRCVRFEKKFGTFAALIKSTPPFSFNYGDRPIRDLLPSWQGQDDGAGNVSWRDPSTGLAIALEYAEFENGQIVEWVLRLTNQGANQSPIVEQLLALDLELQIGPRWLPALTWSPGCAPEAGYHSIAATPLPWAADGAHLSCNGGGKDMSAPSKACNRQSVEIRHGQSLTSGPLPNVHPWR